jgi:hypothetical protein
VKYPQPADRNKNKPVGHCPKSGKAQFHSRSAAKATVRRYVDRTLRPYKCGDCAYWHLGHTYGQDRNWHREVHGRD